MTIDQINRRTHLYLGIGLAPWFLVYALSSVILNHGNWFERPGDNVPEWTKRFERAYRLPPIKDDDSAWVLGEKVLADHGMTGRFGARFDDDDNLVVLRHKLLGAVRLTYFPKEGRILAEDQRFSLRQALTAAHFRSGYGYPYLIE